MDPLLAYWLRVGGIVLAIGWWLLPRLAGGLAKQRQATSQFLGDAFRPAILPTPKVPSAEDTEAAIGVIRRRLIGGGYRPEEAETALLPVNDLLQNPAPLTRTVSAR